MDVLTCFPFYVLLASFCVLFASFCVDGIPAVQIHDSSSRYQRLFCFPL